MAAAITHFFNRLLFYTFAFLDLLLIIEELFRHGFWNTKRTEQDLLRYSIAKDQFWNLSKSPIPGFKHNFYTLRNNLKLHYISNRNGPSNASLVIFLHGFPDTSAMWRYLFQEKAFPGTEATVVAVDLPGFGGSDSFPKYDTQILDALTEFVIAMREQYLPADQSDSTNTFIVGHDWGCILGFRLAAEAPAIADRFILTNAPHVELALANKTSIQQSAAMIFRQFRLSPWKQRSCFFKALNTLKPLIKQVLMMGYISVFNLPAYFVSFFGTTGNYAFLRAVAKSAYDRKSDEFDFEVCLASSLGPGLDELGTTLTSGTGDAGGVTYGASVRARANSHATAWLNMTAYYRDGLSTHPWTKQLETIADLYALESSASMSSSPGKRRRASVSNGTLFSDLYKGALKAPAYVIWGEKDQACSRELCLNGLGDYLAKDSEVTILPRTSHWTPVQKESRMVLANVIALLTRKDAKQVTSLTNEVQKIYPGATLYAKK